MEVYKRELAPSHCILEINEFSLKAAEQVETYQSEIFEAGGCKWSLSLYPNGNKKRGGKDHISLYLNIEETDKFSSGWEVFVNYKLFVYDQINDSYLTIQDVQGAVRRFQERKKQWGFAQLLSLETLRNHSNGYLLDDSCIFGAEVSVLKATTGKSKSSPAKIKLQYDSNNQEKSSDGNEEFTPSFPSTADGVAVYKREQPPTHFTLKIDNFSLLQDKTYWSNMFEAGGYNWSLTVYPNGNKEEVDEGYISIYLKFEEISNNLPIGWEVFVNYKFFIQDQNKGDYLTIQDAQLGAVRRFHENKKEWGFAKLVSLKSFKQKSNGYLVNDSCMLGAEVFVMKPTVKWGFLTMMTQPHQHSPNKLTFMLDNFSTLDGIQYESQTGYYGGQKWRLRVYPKSTNNWYGKGVGVVLVLVGERDLSSDTTVKATVTLRVLDQLNNIKHNEYRTGHTWSGSSYDQTPGNFVLVTLEDLHKPESGLLRNDTLIAQVEFHDS